MQSITNNFNPIRNTGAIVSAQDFAIHSEITRVKMKDGGYMEIQDLELLLKEKLPAYHITGSLRTGKELSIRDKAEVCHIHILEEGKLCYRYSANARHVWIILLIVASFFILPLFLAIAIWYVLDLHYGKKARSIGRHIQHVIQEHDIELEQEQESI